MKSPKHSLRILLEGEITAPNYTEATNKQNSCSTCGAFDDGSRWCEMYNFKAEANMTCDDWVTEEEWLGVQ